jgi:hypothetical protein
MNAPGFITRHCKAFNLAQGPLGDKGGHTSVPHPRHGTTTQAQTMMLGNLGVSSGVNTGRFQVPSATGE